MTTVAFISSISLVVRSSFVWNNRFIDPSFIVAVRGQVY